jgi:hypothetical protein
MLHSVGEAMDRVDVPAGGSRWWPWALALFGTFWAFRDVLASGFELSVLNPGDPRLIQFLF